MAIQCAAAVAVVGGVLGVGALRLPLLTPATILWAMSASLITLGLYQNRRPSAWMDARIGARIGLVAGLCLGAGLAVSLATAGVVARFGIHAMAGFDAQYNDMIQMVLTQKTRASATPLPPEAVGLVHSVEFRGAYMLFSCAFTAVLLMLLSALGGAFGGLLRTRHRATV